MRSLLDSRRPRTRRRPPLGALLVSTLLLVGLAGCASTPDWVPLSGSRETLHELEGRWIGTYDSRETGRSGRIVFELSAESDSAFGDVLMRTESPFGPREFEDEWETRTLPRQEVIAIDFVRAEQDQVKGVLHTYRDPRCGCRLQTVFIGTVEGDRIEGTFTSYSLDRNNEVHGRGVWRVGRIE